MTVRVLGGTDFTDDASPVVEGPTGCTIPAVAVLVTEVEAH